MKAADCTSYEPRLPLEVRDDVGAYLGGAGDSFEGRETNLWG